MLFKKKEHLNNMSRLNTLLTELEEMNKEGEFIGYGNPDSDILIVGQECAFEEGSKEYDKFYKPNYYQWASSFKGHGFNFSHGESEFLYTFENNAFHPIFPFFLQENTVRRKGLHTSSTFYYYQMFVDKLRALLLDTEYTKSKYVTFFRDCFITELNDICMRNHKDATHKSKIIEERIRERFDWMRSSSFYDHFKVVLLACGPYAGTIRKDPILRKELFGDAKIVYCGQLSQWRKRELEGDDKHINEIKEIAKIKPRIHSIEDNQRFINDMLKRNS